MLKQVMVQQVLLLLQVINTHNHSFFFFLTFNIFFNHTIIKLGSLLDQCQKLLGKGIHPTIISESFQEAAKKCVEILENLADKVMNLI